MFQLPLLLYSFFEVLKGLGVFSSPSLVYRSLVTPLPKLSFCLLAGVGP